MTTTVEIASAPTVDTPGTCLFVHSDKRAYLFGRPEEGTQRAFQSRRLGMGATEQVFLSGSVSWELVGGLFGYVLTVGGALEASREQTALINEERKSKGQKLTKQAAFETIHIHGGENLNHTLAACRPVILRQPISVRTHEHRENPRLEGIESIEPDWKDDVLRVWKIPIQRDRSSSPKKRRRSSAIAITEDQEEAQFKEWSPLSDPEYATTLVEKVMFNGRLKGNGMLIPVKLSEVKPKDTTIFIHEEGKAKLYKGPRPGDGSELTEPDQIVWVFPEKEAQIDRSGDILNVTHRPLPPTIYSQSSMCYIVKCLDRRGKFNPQKAKELGVQVTDFKQLTAGNTVVTKDGVTVTPEQVLGETQPGQGFILADIESRDLIDSFMERPEWSNSELMSHVAIVYWILGPGMADDARIQKFVNEHPTMRHFFCAQDTCPNMISLAGPGQLQTKLRRVDPERFTLLKYDNDVKGAMPNGPQVESGRTGTKIALMPRLKFGEGEIAPFPDLLEAAQSVSDEILELARKAREETSDPEFLRKLEEDEQDIPSRDAEIIPLGTGSSIPGKYRNVSSTLIRVPGIGNYLLDVGEGTLGQIRRLFGEEETGNILRDLRCIVISHLHADHHLGTPNMIKAWYEHTIEDTNAKLAISCISRYKALLEEVSQVEDIGFHRLHFPHCSSTKPDKYNTGPFVIENGDFGLRTIKRVPVPHCWLSYGTELELTSGLRIAYSGDCRPSNEFARECEGAHLLIHECTFDDDMLAHAKKKGHSTMGEALEIARKMKARRTLLTHFSQRYVKADSLKRDARGQAGEALMALDLMSVKLGDFKKAAAFQPAIAMLMADAGDK
ncbi:ribonuclease Z [Fusarium napiforme]|uniref:ribonuclease Z n=1 Tax=Fusarium napiforme TaxID=42672 RepID=A0A8H5JHU0_9HYPO|nr:ribonuclease Z [Fusarium napiforme]